jgi:Recombinase
MTPNSSAALESQIAERSRRGKRHKAQQGVINVLSGAPCGYRYVRKTETSAAYYEVIEAEARVVRLVFESYAQQGLSINAIARMLNQRQIPTRTAKTRWERSTVWGDLTQSGVSRQSVLWQDRATASAANHTTDTPAKGSAEWRQCQP